MEKLKVKDVYHHKLKVKKLTYLKDGEVYKGKDQIKLLTPVKI